MARNHISVGTRQTSHYRNKERKRMVNSVGMEEANRETFTEAVAFKLGLEQYKGFSPIGTGEKETQVVYSAMQIPFTMHIERQSSEFFRKHIPSG